MTAPSTAAGVRLLVLADELATVHADVGGARTDAWLAAAVDALCHAFVDLADGRDSPSVQSPVPHLPGGGGEVGRPSCAAAAATLRRVRAAAAEVVRGPDGIPPGLAQDTVCALDQLADALQALAGAGDAAQVAAARPGVHRTLRRCHRMLQPPDTL
jgi:hypothetical protein